MKKKIFVISITLLLCLCSCGAKSSFVPQDEISFNYNNISAGQNNFWLTNDSLCYISNGLYPKYYLVTEQGAEKLSDYRGYGYTCYQCYKDVIYMADIEKEIDESNDDYVLHSYDTKTQKEVELTAIRNCYKFLWLGDSLFFLECETSSELCTLKKYSTASDEQTTISNFVLSFGVLQNKLIFLTKTNNTIDVFEYDDDSSKVTKLDELSIDISANGVFDVEASYTSEFILLQRSGHKSIWKYSVRTKALDIINSDVVIDACIAYDKNSFYTTYEDDENVTNIYKMSNETGETTRIARIKGVCSMFVGSDEGVFVLEHDKSIIAYYSEEDLGRLVYRIPSEFF